MDVIQIEKTGENFRLIYDVKGRYTIHRYILVWSNYSKLLVKKNSIFKK